MDHFTGNDLRKIRKIHRLRRAELAQYLGVSPVTVEKWEQHGENPIRNKYVDKISALAGAGAVGFGFSAIAAPALFPLAALMGSGAILGGLMKDREVQKANELLNGLTKLSESERKKLFVLLNKMRVI